MKIFRHTNPRGFTRTILAAFGACLVIASLAAPALADDDAGLRSVFARGAGGRPLALGGAYVAGHDDLSAVIWNPAGLAGVQRKGLYATHTDLIGLGFSEQFAVVALPSWRLGTFGLSLRRFAVDGIEGRDGRGAITDENLKDAETEIALGYGRSLGAAWRVGATFKLQQQELAGYSDAGIGLDLGLQVHPLLAAGRRSDLADALSLGLQLRNVIEPSLRLLQQDVPDPSAMRLGVACDYPMGDNWSVLAVGDVEKTKDMDTRLHAGLELTLLDLLALRVGSLDGMLTAGSGVTWRNYQLDYSYEDNPLESVHRMGLGIAFGATTEEQHQAVLDRQERHLQDRLAAAFEQQNQRRVDDLVVAARNALAAENAVEVLDLAATIRVLAPETAALTVLEGGAYRLLAEAEEKNGNLTAATLNYSRCLALDPDDRAAAAGLERVRTESDRQTARTAAIRDLFNQAMASFTAGDLVEAREQFADLLKQAPGDPEATAMLQHAEQTLRIRAQSLAERAESLALAGNIEPAREALAECRRLDRHCPAIDATERAIAARIERDRAALRNIEAARRDAESGESVSPAPATAQTGVPAVLKPSFATLSVDQQKEVAELYRKGMNEADDGRRDNALRYWELVWSEAPDYQQVGHHLKEEYLARGMEAFAAGDLDRAIEYWEQTRSIDPDDPRARGYLARAREQLTRIREIRSTQG